MAAIKHSNVHEHSQYAFEVYLRLDRRWLSLDRASFDRNLKR